MPSSLLRFAVFSLVVLWAALPHAHAAVVKTEHVEAELVSEKTAIEPGKPFSVALRLKMQEHWHTYWRNPGDSGLPTRIAWSLPQGYQADTIQWPYPQKLPLGPLMNFGFEGEVFLLTTITPPSTIKAGNEVKLGARAEWLVCKDVCIPENGDLSLTLPVSTTAGSFSRWQSDFVSARAAHAVKLTDWKTASSVQGKQALIRITAPGNFKGALAGLAFYPFRDNVIENAAPQTLVQRGNDYILSVPLAEPLPADLKELAGVLVSPNGWGSFAGKAIQVGADPGQPAVKMLPAASITPAPATLSSLLSSSTTDVSPTPPSVSSGVASAVSSKPSANDLSLWLALVFAFIGGLILNLMPCVFPVLGIKVMSFVRVAGENPRLLRTQGLVFLSGVVVSFWALAGVLLVLRAGGQALGWGFQLQSPGFVTALAILFMLMALNLVGVFEVGARLQNAAGDINAKGIYSEAFFSGVLATLVATPCTAPFMGSALGFTLSQPPAVAILVFTALAFGMAAPLTLLAFFPAGRKWLPKPGAWMETFKQFMAFPLFATVVWLAWVLGVQRGNDAVMHLLAGLLLVAIAAWVYGRWGRAGSKFVYVVTLVLLVGGIVLAWPDASQAPAASAQGDPASKPGELAWQPYSKARLEQLRAQGKTVFVDFTAAWCITCQLNKRVALQNAAVVQEFAALDIVPLKADWTNQDPAITAALAEFGRNAVPLYVLYVGAAPPLVLPEILTPSVVLAELKKIRPVPSAVRVEH